MKGRQALEQTIRMEVVYLAEADGKGGFGKFQPHFGLEESQHFIEIVAIDGDRFADAAGSAAEISRDENPKRVVRFGPRQLLRLLVHIDMNRRK